MKCVVTGAAGFIGSHLCEALLRGGHEVVGVDAFIPYYPQAVKERNLAEALDRPGYRFHRLDLRRDALGAILADAEVVFHLAAMAGLMQSWTDFDGYWTCNAQAPQRLLEATRRSAPRLRRLVYASTSSVYGRFASGDETLPTKPISPYGLTKLAAENLCRAYGEVYGLPVVSLRYFSVYGPRQRPDMGYHRFIRALLREEPIVVYGDGQQVRGNTYVSDCVAATLAAVEAHPGEVYNVGGGEAATVWDILRKLEALAGREAQVRQEAARPGDQRYTFADTTKLRTHLGWEPRTGLDEGLARQLSRSAEVISHYGAGRQKKWAVLGFPGFGGRTLCCPERSGKHSETQGNRGHPEPIPLCLVPYEPDP
jgi:nucleoside-diphosphate-sugar epimerase